MTQCACIPEKGDIPHPDPPDIIIHPNGMRKLSTNILTRHTTGLDNIPNQRQVPKEIAETVTSILSLIFTTSLHQGKNIPDRWMEVEVA